MSETARSTTPAQEDEHRATATEAEEAEPLPLDGTILARGDHLLEVELARPAQPEVFVRALRRMGFVEVIVDQSSTVKALPDPAEASSERAVAVWERWREWGSPTAAVSLEDGPLRFRFVGRLDTPIRLVDTPFVRWIYAHASGIDLMADPSREPFEPAALERGGVYETRFLAWMRTQPTRRAICESLGIMGFQPLKITSLRRNIKLPGLPGTNIVLWYGVARWERPDSYVSAEDPFFFETIRRIG